PPCSIWVIAAPTARSTRPQLVSPMEFGSPRSMPMRIALKNESRRSPARDRERCPHERGGGNLCLCRIVHLTCQRGFPRDCARLHGRPSKQSGTIELACRFGTNTAVLLNACSISIASISARSCSLQLEFPNELVFEDNRCHEQIRHGESEDRTPPCLC